MATNQKLAKKEFYVIKTFDHEVPTVVNVIYDLMVGIVEHMNITSILDID